MKLILLIGLATTLFMTGVIWIIQIVHYPLFNQVGRAGFAAYEMNHSRLITFVVMPPMVVELGIAALLTIYRPSTIPAWAAWMGLTLVGVIWLSTFFLQVPQHTILSNGFDAKAHNVLVISNWVRTVAWSVRSGLMLWMAYVMMP